MSLTCPKCQGAMRQYERNSITIDQCTECRGVFLDRGELDRLIDAESSYYGATGSPSPAAPAAPAYPAAAPAYPPQAPAYPPQPAGYGHRDSHDSRGHGDSHGYYDEHGHKRKKKKSFMDELFD